MSMHRFSTSFLTDASSLFRREEETAAVDDGRSSRGPRPKMEAMMRKLTGRPEFNVVNIEAAVAAKLAARKQKP